MLDEPIDISLRQIKPIRLQIPLEIDLLLAQNWGKFYFQISFSFYQITPLFLNGFVNFKNLKCSELQYGSFAILHVKIGGVIRELWRFKVNLACYSSTTVVGDKIDTRTVWIKYKLSYWLKHLYAHLLLVLNISSTLQTC